MYNFFTMFFFDKNLKRGHKVTLCLVLLGILANGFLWSKLPQKPFVDIRIEQNYTVTDYNVAHIALAYGTFIKIIVLCIFRKF